MKSAEEIINTIKELKLKNDKIAEYAKETYRETEDKHFKRLFKKSYKNHSKRADAYGMLLMELGEEVPHLYDPPEEQKTA